MACLHASSHNNNTFFLDNGDTHNKQSQKVSTNRIAFAGNFLATLQPRKMESVIAMNDLAVLLIEIGRFEESISILSEGLARLEAIQEDEGGEADCSRKEESTNMQHGPSRRSSLDSGAKSSSIPLPKIRKQIINKNSTPTTCDADEESSSEDSDFIYRHPIPSTGLPVDETLDQDSLNILVVYNLALSHHLQAMKERKSRLVSSKPRLLVALRLYQLSFDLQKIGDCALHTVNILALVNNCGQIYKQLNQKKRADKYFQNLLSSLFLAMETNGEPDVTGELEGFIRNASRLILRDSAVAAAA